MSAITIGFMSLYFHLPGCSSLKEKRGRIKPLITRLQREFNISAAELDHQDIWQSSLIGCVMISNDPILIRKQLQSIIKWIDSNWPDVDLVDESIELIQSS